MADMSLLLSQETLLLPLRFSRQYQGLPPLDPGSLRFACGDGVGEFAALRLRGRSRGVCCASLAGTESGSSLRFACGDGVGEFAALCLRGRSLLLKWMLDEKIWFLFVL